MKKLIIIGLILLAAFISNPSHQRHKDKILTKFKEQNPAAATISNLLGIDKLMIDMSIQYNNYYLCSTTQIDKQTVSFGIFGIVFIGSMDLSQKK